MKKKFYYSEGNWILFLNKSQLNFNWEYVKIKGTDTTIKPSLKYRLSEIVDKDLVFDNIHRNANGIGSSFYIYEAKYDSGEWKKGTCVYSESGGPETFFLKNDLPLNIKGLNVVELTKSYFIEPCEPTGAGPIVYYMYKNDSDAFIELAHYTVDKIGDVIPNLNKGLPSSAKYNYYNTYYKCTENSSGNYTVDINTQITPARDKVQAFDVYVYIHRQLKTLHSILMLSDGNPNYNLLFYLNDELLYLTQLNEHPDDVVIKIGLITGDDDEPIYCCHGTKSLFEVNNNQNWTVGDGNSFTFVFDCGTDTTYTPAYITLRYSTETEPFETINFQYTNDRWEAVCEGITSDTTKTIVLSLYVTI